MSSVHMFRDMADIVNASDTGQMEYINIYVYIYKYINRWTI